MRFSTISFLRSSEPDRIRRYGYFFLVFMLYSGIPGTFLLVMRHGGLLISVRGYLSHAFALLMLVCAYWLICEFRFAKVWMWIVSIFAGLLYATIYIAIATWIQIGHPLDPVFFYHNHDATWFIIRYLFGVGTSYVILLCIALVFALYTWMTYRLLRKIPQKSLNAEFLLKGSFAVGCLMLASATFLEYEVLLLVPIPDRDYMIREFPDVSVFNTESTENVFYLELESINALAAGGLVESDGKKYDKEYMPELKKIAQDGVFIPYFWSNTVNTDRSRVTMYCGNINNYWSSYAYTPEMIPRCMPHILADAGYDNVYLSSVKNFTLSNSEIFMDTVGFTDLPDEDLMESDESGDLWGHDDCVFYKRAFEYLEEAYPEKEGLFLNFTATNNHYPFKMREGYEDVHAYPEPENFIERYLNSILQQDHCVGKFYEYFLEYSPENTHLFILPDNSWPVGINGPASNSNGGYVDNFAIPLLYVPPRNRRDEFAVGTTIEDLRFSQTDFMPTVFDLLNNQEYENSFAFALRGGESDTYEGCHVLVQPYLKKGTVIVHGTDKYYYLYGLGTVLYTDLSKDLLDREQEVLAEDVSYEEFLEEYLCERYRV